MEKPGIWWKISLAGWAFFAERKSSVRLFTEAGLLVYNTTARFFLL